MSFIMVPHTNCRALYKLPDVNDSSGNNYTLTNNNTVAFVAGKFGNCANFGSSNTNKYLSVDSDCGINPASEAYSVILLVNLSTQPGSGVHFPIFHIEKNTSGGICFLEYYNDGGTYKLRCRYGSNENNYPIIATKTLTNGIWYLIVVTSSAAGSGNLYTNGALIGSGSRGSTTGTGTFLHIGNGWPVTNWYYYSGLIDEFAYLKYELTASQIRRLYAFQKGILL